MNEPLRVSAAIITLNEETNLPRCLASVRGLVSETVIVDSESTDRTADIAFEAGARFEVRPWQGYVAQKNAALDLAAEPWVLCLDADEAVSPELAESLRRAFAAGEPQFDGFRVNRMSHYLGAWIRHAWYPEWRLRVVRKSRAAWEGGSLHEHLVVGGRTSRLAGHLLHYPYPDLADHMHRTLRYARIAADARARDGHAVGWHHLVVSPWAALLKHLVLKQGFRDGYRGWMISFSALVSVYAKYAFLWEKQLRSPNAQDRQPPGDAIGR